MKVTLLRHTADPELLCGTAALTSTNSRTPSDILKTANKEKARQTIKRVTAFGHVSVIEHASFTFSLEEVSRALTHELVRHRIASYTQQSQRYVTYDTAKGYVTPPKIADAAEARKLFEETLKNMSEAYLKLLKMNIPKEDARFILPNAAKTNIVATMNARELRHFFNLRCCARAQWEIREVAMEMLRQVKSAAPGLFEDSGPSCVELGHCPEGKMKPAECDIQKIREKFKKM